MRCILSFVLIFVLLTGCAAENTAAGAAVETASADATVGTAAADTTVGTASADATVGTAAPASDLREDSSDWKLSDFVPALCEAEAEEERYFIAEGTEWENTVVERRGAAEGPIVYIVGGIHGDETAGWTAASMAQAITACCPKRKRMCCAPICTRTWV